MITDEQGDGTRPIVKQPDVGTVGRRYGVLVQLVEQLWQHYACC